MITQSLEIHAQSPMLRASFHEFNLLKNKSIVTQKTRGDAMQHQFVNEIVINTKTYTDMHAVFVIELMWIEGMNAMRQCERSTMLEKR